MKLCAAKQWQLAAFPWLRTRHRWAAIASWQQDSAISRFSVQQAQLLWREAQVLEAREELDSLEELAACPLVAANPRHYAAFFREAPCLLAPGTGLAAFQARLQELLLPEYPHLLAVTAQI